jgi:predicted glycoside hydrolase/deacetylase ChbG (UPF0249 family)
MIAGNLIINADDFGLDERVSRAIELCLDEGLINSFSVFPFRDGFHGSLLKGILARHPDVKVGAHLALAGSAEEHKDHYKDFLKRYLTGRISAADVKSIWRSQIRDLGGHLGGAGKISHLDSHQHLHVLPGLWRATVELRREFGIPRVRVPYESLARAVGHRFPFGLGMQVLARMRVEKGAPGFVGFFTSTCFTLEANRRALEKARLGERVELMVHPALPRGPMAAVGDAFVVASDAENAFIEPAQLAEIGELRKLKAMLNPAQP